MALSAAWSCSLALLVALISLALPTLIEAEYPGVIELVGYSNRRARTHFVAEASPNPTLTPPAAKTRADIETVKRNMKKYDRLLELDTKNLPEPQKDMLARIVERVARLKETLDIEEQQLIQHEATSARSSSTQQQQLSTEQLQQQQQQDQSTMPTTGYTETETDPTLLLDETTLLELQHSMNEQAALQAEVTAQTTLMKELPTTTDAGVEGVTELELGETTAPALTTLNEETGEEEEKRTQTTSSSGEQPSTTSVDDLTDATDTDDQFVAARSNNNIAAITAADAEPSSGSTSTTSAGNQRTLTTMGKLGKIRATKRPFGHKVTAAIKRNGQRPSSGSAAAANAAAAAAASKPPSATSSASSSTATTMKQKLSSSNQYQQQQQKLGATKQQQQKVTTSSPALPIEQLYTRLPQANIPLPAAAGSAAAAAAAAAGGAAAAAAGGAGGSGTPPAQDSLYDGHVNASALIDSLNTNAREEYYQQKLGASSSSIGNGNNNNKDNKKTATAKPTKYHYYPHNQHIYLLPECAIQQVCNAVYVRLNYTQPLCACPSRYRDPCSASLNEDDQHTTKLVGDNKKKAITLAKTCEATTEMRECRSPKDWSLLALQNTRTGKSHYLVICRCPDHFKMEGPMAHDQPTYASVPGIRVFGMMCVKPGYSVRKPSSQPPKRYQLQKPFYRPSSGGAGGGSILGGQKDSYGRPIYGGGSSSGSQVGSSAISANYQPQDQSFQAGGGGSTYQYLNRPESSHTQHSSPNFRPDQFSLSGFPGSNYGRNNERRGEAPPIEAANEDGQLPSSSTQASDEAEARTTLQAESEQSESSTAELTTLPESSRSKRALDNELEYEPEFPWDRVLEFQQTIVWD